MGERREGALRIVVILLGFFILSLGYALVSPPLENPDELSHAEYAGFIGARHRLPTLDRDCVRMAFHPPLYHALLAPIATAMGLGPEEIMSGHQLNPDFATTGVMLVHGYPDEGFPFAGLSRFIFVGRLLSIACALVVLMYTDRLVCLFTPDPMARVVGVAVVAAVPQFEYLAASLNHDLLAAALAAMALFYAVQLADMPALSTALKCGIALGLGLVTKSSVVPLLIVPALALVGGTSERRLRIRCGAGAYGATIVVAGWWYVRNAIHYGRLLPTVALHETTWVGSGLVHHGPVDLAYVRNMLGQLFQSFWLLAGLMNVPAFPWMYGLWAALSVVVGFGMLLLLREPRGRVLVFAWLAVLAGVIQYNLHIYSAQGRYLFIVLAPVGVAVAYAIASLPFGWRRPSGMTLVAVTICLAVVSFWQCFRPHYTTMGLQERPTERDTARLYCRNDYLQPFRSAGGDLHGLTFRAHRLGEGSADLEVALETTDGRVVRRALLSGRTLAERSGDATAWFEPVSTTPGQMFRVSFRAPNATPLSRVLVTYSTNVDAGERFVTLGHVGPGGILVRGEYE